MIVYRILNKLDGKEYVGQTVKRFNQRYPGGKWWLYSSNDHLKAAANKHGVDNFEVTILRDDIDDLQELDAVEREYIRSHNTIYPHGYNHQDGGQYAEIRKHHPLIGEKIAKTKSNGRTYRLLDNENGEIHEFTNISAFCRERDLSLSQISQVLASRRNRYSVWSLPNRPLKKTVLLDPTGKRHIVPFGSMARFCSSHHLTTITMFCVIRGQRPHHKRWTFVETYQ